MNLLKKIILTPHLICFFFLSFIIFICRCVTSGCLEIAFHGNSLQNDCTILVIGNISNISRHTQMLSVTLQTFNHVFKKPIAKTRKNAVEWHLTHLNITISHRFLIAVRKRSNDFLLITSIRKIHDS